MIKYRDGQFGLHILLRVRGSAAYKALLYACASNGVYALFYYYGGGEDGIEGLKQYELLDHPYPVTVIVTAFMFVLSSKVTFAYNRYWEACSALHNMHAKWLDVGSTLAAFHMQSKAYDKIKPPSYGDHDEIDVDDLVIRGGGTESSSADENDSQQHARLFTSEETSDGGPPQAPKMSVLGKVLNIRHRKRTPTGRRGRVSIQSPASRALPYPDYANKVYKDKPVGDLPSASEVAAAARMTISAAQKLPRRSSNGNGPSCGGNSLDPPNSPTQTCVTLATMATMATAATDATAHASRTITSIGDERNNKVPSLFLQEAAHLLSLLSAVALSTLRCEGDGGVPAPLSEFVPGGRWPSFDSYGEPDDVDARGDKPNALLAAARRLLDVRPPLPDRVARSAARPLPVVGGVSPREADLLRSARGSSAKVALAFLWLQEFMMREQLHGSIGAVAPPIFSRLPQFLSDGHLWYNAARKVSYVPFPFPHAQMASMFEVVCVFLIPGLMLSKTAMWFGFALNFLTVMLFQGLNELSKELEDPFRGSSNELPLNLFQAQFNEAVVTMFAGYHPDAWWEVKGEV